MFIYVSIVTTILERNNVTFWGISIGRVRGFHWADAQFPLVRCIICISILIFSSRSLNDFREKTNLFPVDRRLGFRGWACGSHGCVRGFQAQMEAEYVEIVQSLYVSYLQKCVRIPRILCATLFDLFKYPRPFCDKVRSPKKKKKTHFWMRKVPVRALCKRLRLETRSHVGNSLCSHLEKF